jgi:hypothetical protein
MGLTGYIDAAGNLNSLLYPRIVFLAKSLLSAAERAEVL